MCHLRGLVRVSGIVTLMAIVLAGPAFAQDIFALSCPQLWYQRNSIFKAAGYCFHTPRTIRVLGNAGWMPDVNGIWKPLNADDRLMTIKLLKGKITIEAIDLFCTLTDLQSQATDLSKSPPSVTASSVCYDESDTIYAKDTLTVLSVGQDVFLFEATVLLRHLNESEPKIDEAYTNRPAIITIYRKVKLR